MKSLNVVQLEAKPGLLIATLEEGRDSRQLEIPLRLATAKQQLEWQRLAGRSAIDLYDLLADSSEPIIAVLSRPKARLSAVGAASRRSSSASVEPDATGEAHGSAAAVETDAEGLASVRTELPFDSGDAAWVLAAEERGGEDLHAALAAAASVARTRLAFGLTLAGVDPGELASAALAAWGDGWAVAPDEAALKAAPRAASEGGGREIAEWIASAAEKGVLHEHGRLPEAAAVSEESASPQLCDLSLLPDAVPAEAALKELRRAMRARMKS